MASTLWPSVFYVDQSLKIILIYYSTVQFPKSSRMQCLAGFVPELLPCLGPNLFFGSLRVGQVTPSSYGSRNYTSQPQCITFGQSGIVDFTLTLARAIPTSQHINWKQSRKSSTHFQGYKIFQKQSARCYLASRGVHLPSGVIEAMLGSYRVILL